MGQLCFVVDVNELIMLTFYRRPRIKLCYNETSESIDIIFFIVDSDRFGHCPHLFFIAQAKATARATQGRGVRAGWVGTVCFEVQTMLDIRHKANSKA